MPTSRSAPTPIHPLLIPFGFTIVLAGFSLLPRVREVAALQQSFWIATGGLLVWLIALAIRSARSRRKLQLEIKLYPSHYVQAAVQIPIYLYWGWFWRPVYEHLWLVAAQIVFLYAFDSLLQWSRRDTWKLGFGPFPIILSTNLFLWFHDDWFALQFAMVALGSLGKEFIRWDRDGRRAHIFNPSGFSLSFVSLILILTGTTTLTTGVEIAASQAFPPQIYLTIFLLGLIVQYFFSVTLVTLAAAATLILLNLGYTAATGVYYFTDTFVPVAVFLGLHFLVTDPATSPRSASGRVVFGALYGLGVFVLYGALTSWGVPSFYDKLLPVPLLNLSVRWIERITPSELFAHWGKTLEGFSVPRLPNLIHMALWIGICVPLLATGYLGPQHEGASVSFWQEACVEQRPTACARLQRVLRTRCDAGEGFACSELGAELAEHHEDPAGSAAATVHFLRACQLGENAGCANLVIQCLFRASCDGLEGAVALAVSRLDEECQAGDAGRCELVGHAYLAGQGVPKDPRGALESYQRSCELGAPRGCVSLARAHLRDSAGQRRDIAQAHAAFRKACDIGHAESCDYLASLNKESNLETKKEDL